MKNLKYMILLFGLAKIAWTDKKEKRISNKTLGVLLMFRILVLLLESSVLAENLMAQFCEALHGFTVGGSLFLLCYFASSKNIGAGDVKLLAVIGSYLGSDEILWTAFLAVVYAAVYFFWKIFVKKENLERKIAFAPFVFVGMITIWMIN